MRKRILFRCDGGNIPEIGTGHIVRSLALAQGLRKKNPATKIAFLVSCCGETLRKISEQGFPVFAIDKGADEVFATIKAIRDFTPDIIVIDRLATDANYISLVKKTGVVVITLDDSGAGAKYADITINPIITTGRGLYEGLDYMVLPDSGGRRSSCKQDCSNVFISFGGFDCRNITKKIILSLLKKELPFTFHIAVGGSYQGYRRLKKAAGAGKRIKLYRGLSIADFSKLLHNSDIAITSGGLTMFQAVASGIPALVIAHYRHQLQSARRLQRLGAALSLGMAEDFSAEKLVNSLSYLAANFSKRKSISESGKGLIDGLGNERVAEAVGIIDRLSWDSRFFGVNIAYLYPKKIREDIVRFALRKCEEDDIDCLYYLSDCHDPESVRLAEKYGFHFVDIRLTFTIRLKDGQERRGPDGGLAWQSNLLLRPAAGRDEAALQEIARESYIDSRYFFDKHFPEARCREFYASWIKKSARGKLDDMVLVAESKGEIAGYISSRLDSPNAGSIGLVGVAKRFRGQKLGRSLVAAMLKRFSERGVSQVNVVTQGRNIAAQRLYQACGFKTSSTELWYHKWFKKEYGAY